MTDARSTLHPFPTGWYCLGRSDHLQRGQVRTQRAFGRDLVVYRTRLGLAVAVDPYCPHLGAHLGHGGTVEGEDIRCPFHGFCFAPDGSCTKTGYGTRPPVKARTKSWHLRDQNGFLLVWFDEAGLPPRWEVPLLDDAGWTPLQTETWSLAGHPQETTENSADLGHLSIVHGYADLQVTSVSPEGPVFRASYRATRSAGVFGKPRERFHLEFDIEAHGLGISFVEASVPAFGMRTRHYVLATPTEQGHIDLHIASRTKGPDKPGAMHPALAVVPAKVVQWFAARATFQGFRHDVMQDFEIWKHKRYVHPPVLAEGDGPIGKYRTWAMQFHPGRGAAEGRVVATAEA